MTKLHPLSILAISATLFISAQADEAIQTPQKLVGDRVPGEWIDLFNGKDLTGWTPKFMGYKAGMNHNNAFQVDPHQGA